MKKWQYQICFRRPWKKRKWYYKNVRSCKRNQTTGTQRKIDYQNKWRTYLKLKKAVRNHSKILRKHLLYKRNTNAKPITNTNVNTIHIIRLRKSVWSLKIIKAPEWNSALVTLIKYSPAAVYEKVANIYNNIEATGRTQMKSGMKF